jgi:hypothetical protein
MMMIGCTKLELRREHHVDEDAGQADRHHQVRRRLVQNLRRPARRPL